MCFGQRCSATAMSISLALVFPSVRLFTDSFAHSHPETLAYSILICMLLVIVIYLFVINCVSVQSTFRF